MKREIPLIITGVIGVVFLIQFFIPHEPFSSLSDIFSDWFSIIEACAICIAADRKITVDEAELLRVVADSLGCPIPPLLPGQTL